jgi:hypothetical protein
MLHQFLSNFELEQSALDIVKEYLDVGEAAMLDQAYKPVPSLEDLEPISNNEEEDQECISEDILENGSSEDHDQQEEDQH